MSLITDKILAGYPSSTNHCIAEVFSPNDGWHRKFGNSLPPLTEKKIEELKKKNCTHINVYLVDEWGVVKYPDYSIEELLRK